MFTGIVQSVGTIVSLTDTGAGKRLRVALGDLSSRAGEIRAGDSVCVSGVCLTVVSVDSGVAAFDVVTETLRRSTLGHRSPGDKINLELSLQPASFVGGHFVQGHVDAVGKVRSVRQDAADWLITITFPREFAAMIVPKGSIAVEGVSMTIAAVDDASFTLAVIPTTLTHSTLGTLRAGDEVNIETDILARTVVHWLRGEGAALNGQRPNGEAPVTLEKLHKLGFA